MIKEVLVTDHFRGRDGVYQVWLEWSREPGQGPFKSRLLADGLSADSADRLSARWAGKFPAYHEMGL